MSNLKSERTSEEIVCALITGTAKVAIIQPFDLLRFRIQSSFEYPINITKLVRSLIDKEGLRIFIKGSNATCLGVFLSSFVQFSLYQKFFSILTKGFFEKYVLSANNLDILKVYKLDRHYNHSDKLGTINFDSTTYKQRLIYKFSLICGFAGFLSGLGLSLITLPIDNIRIKLQSVQNLKNTGTVQYRNNGMKDVAIDIYKTYGLTGFYIGFPISLARECIASTIYFGSFEYMKNREKINYHRKDIKNLHKFLYGAIAGGLNWIITLPIDIVKTKLISDTIKVNNSQYKGAYDCCLSIYKMHGLKGFYSGFSVVFLRGVLVNGATLSSFDFCRTHYIK